MGFAPGLTFIWPWFKQGCKPKELSADHLGISKGNPPKSLAPEWLGSQMGPKTIYSYHPDWWHLRGRYIPMKDLSWTKSATWLSKPYVKQEPLRAYLSITWYAYYWMRFWSWGIHTEDLSILQRTSFIFRCAGCPIFRGPPREVDTACYPSWLPKRIQKVYG